MTFGGMAAWEAWLLLGGTAALAAWIFLRKLRPPRVVVASLLLWQQVLDAPRERTLWERVRRAVSLVLTVAIALALALAVTRPSLRSDAPSAARGRVLVIIDSSWSMLTRTRAGESRFERALAQARRLTAAESGKVIALATTADGLVEGPTTDLTLIDSALDRITPAGGDATAWPRLAGAETVHFITDGAMARLLPPGVIVHSVFEAAANVGITAFDVRPSLSTADAGAAYLEIVNFASAPQNVQMRVTRGEASILDRRVPLGAGEALRQVLPLGRGGDPALHARVEAPDNALPVDDEAFAWNAQATPVSITVVGQQTAWLRPLLAGDPDVRAVFLDPARYDLATAGEPGAPDPAISEDLTIFDGWAPHVLPARPAIYVAPPPELPWLAAQPPGAIPARAWDSTEETRPRWVTAGTHPVVVGVDPLTLKIDKARSYGAAGLTPVARSARGTPLVYVSDTPARRFVVLTFGARESNLASAPGFPVLFGNAIDWLVRPDVRTASTTGLAAFNGATGRLTGPGGTDVPLARAGGTAFAVLRVPGLYVAEGAGARSTFAVNVGGPEVSNAARTNLSASDQARPVTAGTSGRSWWLYCAAGAFVLALAEWWTWQRRITV
jgi:hypothetical protein